MINQERMEDKPFFSIVVFVRDSPHLLSVTMDSILHQSFSSYEIILVISSNSPIVHEALEYYKDKIAKVYYESDENLANLMNKGISYSDGRFIHFLHPGDTYLSLHALEHISLLAQNQAAIIYCGYLFRTADNLPEAVVYPLNLDLLKHGKLPTRLQCFWFSKEVFNTVGLFNPHYHYRPGFDMVCRIFDKKECPVFFTHRVLVDYEYRKIPPSEMLRFAFETFFLILKNFGLGSAFAWWFIQDQIGFVKWLKATFKQAFYKR